MLQLDVRNLSLRMRHLVNAYTAGIGVIAANTMCDPCLSALRGFTTRRYINPRYTLKSVQVASLLYLKGCL